MLFILLVMFFGVREKSWVSLATSFSIGPFILRLLYYTDIVFGTPFNYVRIIEKK